MRAQINPVPLGPVLLDLFSPLGFQPSGPDREMQAEKSYRELKEPLPSRQLPLSVRSCLSGLWTLSFWARSVWTLSV